MKESKSLIEDWKRRRAGAKNRISERLKRFAKHPKSQVDKAADQTHDKVFQKLDCLDCANCCTSIPPIINDTDARRIAKHLGMNPGAFMTEYVIFDEDDDMVINSSPCPFLGSDNYCSIYEARPKACREYPHTDEGTFSRNLRLHQPNAHYCPAVFHILEEMERKLL